MNSKFKILYKDVSLYLTNYFPLAFSVAVCFGFDPFIGILFSCISILFSPDIDKKNLMPVIISFIIIGSQAQSAFGASVICAILLIVSSFFIDKIKKFISAPIASGIMLSGALTATVLFTTNYFGIGATGSNVTEMIKSYISLGFHPNWRGVLYGTIVLVLMITFPRKFKNLNKFVSASFIALLFTLILNLFLNPSDMISAINEITPSNAGNIKEYFTSRFTFNINCIPLGLTLYLLFFSSIIELGETKQKDLINNGIINVISSGFFGSPLPYGINKNKRSLPSRIISAFIIFVMFLLFKDLFFRIPIHSCAVVIIVSAWDSVRWANIRKCFNNFSIFACFISSVALCLLTDMVYGIIFSSIISVIYFLITKHNKKSENLR